MASKCTAAQGVASTMSENYNPDKYDSRIDEEGTTLYRKKQSKPLGSDLSEKEVKTAKDILRQTLGGAREQDAMNAVALLLSYMGQNSDSPGLKDTPRRVVRALKEMTFGYLQDPREILGTVFEDDYDEVVISKDIPFTSLCEHHLLVFSGTASIGYIPAGGKVVGLSKLARLLDCFALRLQLQERLTRDIANSLNEVLKPQGVGVIIRAQHSCMACRGVKKAGSTMVTSCMLGIFRSDASARAEFLKLSE